MTNEERFDADQVGLVPAVWVHTYKNDDLLKRHLPELDVDLRWNSRASRLSSPRFTSEWVLHGLSLGFVNREGRVDEHRASGDSDPRTLVGLDPDRLVGAVNVDRTHSGDPVVVFAVDLADVTEISVTRPRRLGRYWDHGELHGKVGPRAWLSAESTYALDDAAEALKREHGGHLRGCVGGLVAAVAAHRGEPRVEVEDGTEGLPWQKFRSETFTF